MSSWGLPIPNELESWLFYYQIGGTEPLPEQFRLK